MIPLMVHILYSGFTLYMLLILVRWAAPWLQIDLWDKRLRWITQATEPAFNWLRHRLPSFGPVDFTPFVLLLAVWVVREMLVGMMVGIHQQL